jgi:hypothetical protein
MTNSYRKRKVKDASKALRSLPVLDDRDLHEIERKQYHARDYSEMKLIEDLFWLERSVQVAVNRFRYRAYKWRFIQHGSKKIHVCLKPVGKGDIACSSRSIDEYEYTHGGRTFRDAVDLAKEIRSELDL